MNEVVPLGKLAEKPYSQIICYPNPCPDELQRRLTEMGKLGVNALSFVGEKRLSNMPILGKGCVGIVVSAYTDKAKVALKIRRTDADRSGMQHEAQMLRIANSVNVGPELLGFTDNLLMMEYIEGMLLPRWVEVLGDDEESRQQVREVMKDILEQSWRLDEIGMDHGELSRAPRHIVVDRVGKAHLLDFETASTARKVSNVTSVCQYLFISGRMAKAIAGKIGEVGKADLLSALSAYKRNRKREAFERIERLLCLEPPPPFRDET